MAIVGLQKLTLLDYPGKVACTVFLSGCNFQCPFCHNSGLLDASQAPQMAQEEFFGFLQDRKGLLDAVCVSGGEPTLFPGLQALLERIKALGYLVKLDTNGSRPEVLKALVRQNLVDYVAMDVKNSTGVEVRLQDVEESLRFLLEGNIDYELRTTVVSQLHNADAFTRMGQWLASLVPGKKPKKLFLQTYVDRESILAAGLTAPESAQMQRYLQL